MTAPTWGVLVERQHGPDVLVEPFPSPEAADAHQQSAQLDAICEEDALDCYTVRCDTIPADVRACADVRVSESYERVPGTWLVVPVPLGATS